MAVIDLCGRCGLGHWLDLQNSGLSSFARLYREEGEDNKCVDGEDELEPFDDNLRLHQ
jgi:hypothetical protein